MLITLKKAANILHLKYQGAYYHLTMGHIEAIKVGSTWRLALEEVQSYAKRHLARKNREPSGYFIYPGDCGFLFGCLPDSLPHDPQEKTSGVERRRGQLVHRARRSKKVLFSGTRPLIQLNLF